MKIYFLFTITMLICFLSKGQNETIIRNNKSLKTNLKVRDTFDLNHMGTINSKIDTLYIRDLNPQKSEKSNILKDILPIIGVVIGGILGWLSQLYLKKQERRVNSQNIKEAKRIQHLEHISSLLNGLSLTDANNSQLILNQIEELRKYAFNNNIYISDNYNSIIDSTCDYFNSVAGDFRMKDIEKEMEFGNQFKRLFNR